MQCHIILFVWMRSLYKTTLSKVVCSWAGPNRRWVAHPPWHALMKYHACLNIKIPIYAMWWESGSSTWRRSPTVYPAYLGFLVPSARPLDFDPKFVVFPLRRFIRGIDFLFLRKGPLVCHHDRQTATCWTQTEKTVFWNTDSGKREIERMRGRDTRKLGRATTFAMVMQQGCLFGSILLLLSCLRLYWFACSLVLRICFRLNLWLTWLLHLYSCFYKDRISCVLKQKRNNSSLFPPKRNSA